MRFDEIVDGYTKLCLKYPMLTLEQVLNKYMHLLPAEDAMGIQEKALIMIGAGEAAREADPVVKKMIMEEVV